MNRQSLVKYYTWAIKGLMLAIPLFSLYVPTSMFFPYITGRNFAFRILVELALALWVGLIFLSKEHRPRPSLILMAVLVFGLIVGAADLLGVDPYHSFWSRYERMEGYAMILHLIAYGLMLTTVFRTKKDWKFLFNVFIGVGLIVGFYGILQKLGYRPALQGGQRIDGTIGNPTYLAAYLLLISFITLHALMEVKRKWIKWIYGAVFAYFLFIIFLTASRGPILALILSAFLIPLLYLIFAKKKEDEARTSYRKAAIGILALMIAVPAVFFITKDTNFVQSNYIFKRFADLSFTEKTTRSRFMIWDMSWQGFKERPILGWGQENYTTVFAKYYNPRLYDQEPWFDRAHNIIFDWLINAGALGLLAYLSIFIVFFMTLWKLFQKGVMSAVQAIVFFTGLIAYFFQNLFVFDNFNTYILFFGILAYVNSLENDSTSAPPPRPPESGTVKTGGLSTPVIATATALAVSLAASYFVNIRPIKESLAMIDILASGQNAPDGALDRFNKTLAYQTFGDTEVREQFGRLAIDLVSAGNIPAADKVNFIKAAAEELEKHSERFPLDVRMRMTLATLYNRAAPLDAVYIAKARLRIDEALRLGPNRQQAHFASAENYLLTGQLDKAVAALQDAVNLEPSFIDAQENLGMIAVYAGRDDIVQQAVEKIKVLRPANGAPFVRIATAYLKAQKLAKSMEVYKIAVEAEPTNAEYHANLAALYLENGFKLEAIAEAKKAAELDPANYTQKAEDFLKQVK